MRITGKCEFIRRYPANLYGKGSMSTAKGKVRLFSCKTMVRPRRKVLYFKLLFKFESMVGDHGSRASFRKGHGKKVPIKNLTSCIISQGKLSSRSGIDNLDAVSVPVARAFVEAKPSDDVNRGGGGVSGNGQNVHRRRHDVGWGLGDRIEAGDGVVACSPIPTFS